jgi:hypothetical protein
MSVFVFAFFCFFINHRVKRYLGPVLLHFLKDAFSVRGVGAGSMGSYYYLMISEASSVARAHVAALGGNTLLMYRYKSKSNCKLFVCFTPCVFLPLCLTTPKVCR